MKPLPVRPSELPHILVNLMRETGRSREDCAVAFQQSGNVFRRAANLLKENVTPVAPALPPEGKRSPAPPKETAHSERVTPYTGLSNKSEIQKSKEEEVPAKFIPLPSAFPHDVPTVRVPNIPAEYWIQWEAEYAQRCADRQAAERRAILATQRRAREVCGRLAALAAKQS